MRRYPYPCDYVCVSCFEDTCAGCGILFPEQEEEERDTDGENTEEEEETDGQL